jgi:hypothetical protein
VNRIAVDLPIPDDAPVIIETLFAKFSILYKIISYSLGIQTLIKDSLLNIQISEAIKQALFDSKKYKKQ